MASTVPSQSWLQPAQLASALPLSSRPPPHLAVKGALDGGHILCNAPLPLRLGLRQAQRGAAGAGKRVAPGSGRRQHAEQLRPPLQPPPPPLQLGVAGWRAEAAVATGAAGAALVAEGGSGSASSSSGGHLALAPPVLVLVRLQLRLQLPPLHKLCGRSGGRDGRRGADGGCQSLERTPRTGATPCWLPRQAGSCLELPRGARPSCSPPAAMYCRSCSCRPSPSRMPLSVMSTRTGSAMPA